MNAPVPHPAASGVVLQAHGLSKEFGNVRAVDDLSFTVPPGAITGFLGPNGAGKTTTLRMMLGLIRPTAGTATLGGVPFESIPRPARVVGAVLDTLCLHPNRSALGHLEVFGAAIGVSTEAAQRNLALVGLSAVARNKVRTFSLGMRQRLALATALLGDPSVLVLDEPANGLDPSGIAWLRDFLREFSRRGGTVLTSSHILREIEHTADHLVIIGRGALVYQGSLGALRAQYRSRVLVASSSPVALATALAAHGFTDAQVQPDGRLAVAGATERDIAALAAGANVEVFGMVGEAVDLEQVFLWLTAGPRPGGRQ
ncbi:MAG TPA: ATP-binding cassette domain-containing protein [Aldersonia sp.]